MKDVDKEKSNIIIMWIRPLQIRATTLVTIFFESDCAKKVPGKRKGPFPCRYLCRATPRNDSVTLFFEPGTFFKHAPLEEKVYLQKACLRGEVPSYKRASISPAFSVAGSGCLSLSSTGLQRCSDGLWDGKGVIVFRVTEPTI